MTTATGSPLRSDQLTRVRLRVILFVLRARAVFVLVALLVFFSAMAPSFLDDQQPGHSLETCSHLRDPRHRYDVRGPHWRHRSFGGLISRARWNGRGILADTRHRRRWRSTLSSRRSDLCDYVRCLSHRRPLKWMACFQGWSCALHRHTRHSLYCARRGVADLEWQDISQPCRSVSSRQYRLSAFGAKSCDRHTVAGLDHARALCYRVVDRGKNSTGPTRVRGRRQ